MNLPDWIHIRKVFSSSLELGRNKEATQALEKSRERDEKTPLSKGCLLIIAVELQRIYCMWDWRQQESNIHQVTGEVPAVLYVVLDQSNAHGHTVTQMNRNNTPVHVESSHIHGDRLHWNPGQASGCWFSMGRLATPTTNIMMEGCVKRMGAKVMT